MNEPDPLWKRLAGALGGLILMALFVIVVGRFSGLSRDQLESWGELIVIAPFLAAGIALLHVQRRNRR